MLDGQEGREAALDPETFQAVWERVRPQGGGAVELAAGPGPEEGLQELILACRADAGAYRALARRGRRSGELERCARVKDDHVRRLTAAYFLRTGVRYRPPIPARGGDGPWFSALRARFLAEEEREKSLAALARRGDAAVAELCGQLGRETAELMGALRRLTEREM